jgi:Fur family transcriptional regulator, ferric uptake regulator
MTKSRQAVLSLMNKADTPLSAADLFHAVQASGLNCDQATVYRTLHYLEENGYADSFVLHCTEHGTERFFTAHSDETGTPLPHRHWFHCEACHRFTDLGECGLHKLVADYEKKHSFEIHTHTLYFTGLCAACAKTTQERGALHELNAML